MAISTLPSTLPASSTPASSTPASSTPASTLPASSTPADPVAVALNKIFKESAVSKLWQEKVTNASNIFTQFAGLFVYLWNKGEALEQDVTIEKINVALQNVVKTTAVRDLTQEEVTNNKLPTLALDKPKTQQIYLQTQKEAEKALTEFYTLFKERVKQLGSTEQSNDFGVYAAGAVQAIRERANATPFQVDGINLKEALNIKIETAVNGFNREIFYGMVNSFADKRIEDITIQGFKDQVVLIKGFFTSNSTVDIETALRKAIKAKHDSTQFNTIRTEFLNPAADAPRFVAARDALKAKLEAEKTALEAELRGLRGNGFDGTMHTAFLERQAAEAEKNQAYTALVNAFRLPSANLNENDVTGTLNTIISYLGAATATSSAGTSIATIQGLLATYQQKAAAFETKKAAHDALGTRFNEIATYSGSDVPSGGRLHQVTTGLQGNNLDRDARNELTTIANFYNALSKDVTDINKDTRSATLRAIIGQ
jgi:hypothetical protein